METIALELDAALAAVAKEGDCGCGGRKSGGGASAPAGEDLAAELDAALDSVEAEDVFGAAAGDDDPFSDLAMAPSLGLEDLVAVAERHPGLKICISF